MFEEKQQTLEDQIRECRDYCEERGYVVLEEHPIRSCSGGAPQYDRMVEDVKAGKINTVVSVAGIASK